MALPNFLRLGLKQAEESKLQVCLVRSRCLNMGKIVYLKLTIARDAKYKSHYLSSLLGIDTLINER